MEYHLSEGILWILVDENLAFEQVTKWLPSLENIVHSRMLNVAVFDFKRTIFMDSAGIGLLISIYRDMQMKGGRVGIINMSSTITKMCQIAGLEQIIDFYQNENEMAVMLEGYRRERDGR